MAPGKGQHIVLTYTRVSATVITPAQRASAFSSSQYQTHQLGHVGCDGVHSAPVPVVSIQDLLFLLVSKCSPPREGVTCQKEDHSDTNKLSYNHGYFKPEGSSGCLQRVKNTQLSCILTEQSMWHSLSLSLFPVVRSQWLLREEHQSPSLVGSLSAIQLRSNLSEFEKLRT